MKDATPISAGSAAALTARITATLGPLDADEQACCEKLEELGRKVADLQEQIADAQDNLRIIKAAKVDAIRGLMAEDPLLAEAFRGDSPEASSIQAVADAEELVEAAEVLEEDDDVVEATDESSEGEDANPLLKMDD